MKKMCRKGLHEYEVGVGCPKCKKERDREWNGSKETRPQPTPKKPMKVTTRVTDLSQSVFLNGNVAWQMKNGESVFGEWLYLEYGLEGVKAVLKAIETIQEGEKHVK